MMRCDRPPTRRASGVALLAAIALAGSVTAWEYEVTLLPTVSDAFYTTPSDLNDSGTVVGQALVGSPPLLVAWRWRPGLGLEVLPPPPGLASYRAMGVNDAGVITGDGGVDWGEAWRYEAGTYEMLGSLPGDSMSVAAAINEDGVVAGTSLSPSTTDPRNAYSAAPGGGPSEVQADAWATRINAGGQVVGYYVGNVAYRHTPDAGTLTLPPLGERVLSWAWGINARGDVVGEAAQANGNGHVPFLFTDAAGMQPIGTFNGGATAVDIDDRGTVLGHLESGGPHPWIWTAAGGVRFLADLIDPAAGVQLLSVRRLDARGVILGYAVDTGTGERHPVLLTPTAIFEDGFESGDTSAWSSTVP